VSTDVEDRLQKIRTKQQDSHRKRAQAEARLDAARARQAEALQALRDLGFSTVAEARDRAVALEAETEQILADIEAKVKDL
jgi:hypothetical protein